MQSLTVLTETDVEVSGAETICSERGWDCEAPMMSAAAGLDLLKASRPGPGIRIFDSVLSEWQRHEHWEPSPYWAVSAGSLQRPDLKLKHGDSCFDSACGHPSQNEVSRLAICQRRRFQSSQMIYSCPHRASPELILVQQ